MGKYFDNIKQILTSISLNNENQTSSFLVSTPKGPFLLSQKEKDIYCFLTTDTCGSLKKEKNTLTLSLKNNEQITFKYNNKKSYNNKQWEQVRKYTDSELLLEEDFYTILYDQKELKLHKDIYGNLTDEAGSYFGTILSFGYTKNNQQHMFVRLKDNKISLFTREKDKVYTQKPYIKNQPKILELIPSYKRPVLLSGQIFRLMYQTYKNIDIRVSITGIEKNEGRLMLEKEFESLISTGKLILTYNKNTQNQFINIANTLKNIDLDKYDYFCRIDDDDWYAPTYFETIVNHLNNYPSIGLSYLMGNFVLTSEPQKAELTYTSVGPMGATHCFKKNIAEEIIKISKMSALEIQKTYNLSEKNFNTHYSNGNRVINEDVFLINVLSPQKNIENLIIQPIIPLFIYNKQYPSITRNKI